MEGEERKENSTVDSGVGHLQITWQVSLVDKDFTQYSTTTVSRSTARPAPGETPLFPSIHQFVPITT